MNRVIAALHSVDYAAVGLADYGKPGSYFARQIDRWSKQYRASETEKIEAMDNLIEWLPANIPAGDETASCTATTASTTSSSTRPSRASSPCSTGSCPRSATRSPTSPTTA
jgi:hypothetical protein